ncbi:energy transducer TonB [Chitinibacter sp. S2-10]|uniref:energy transducer TonB n=1 Tax=Chitinibacter sp. S2-10 TaxID=3373597 RepID=UPI0039773158
MAAAISFSLIVHAFPIFGIKFVLPDPRQFMSKDPLDIVLVNQKTSTRPQNAEVQAQADLDGGGNTDALGHRVKSPLPAKSKESEPELEQNESQLKKLEEQSAQLMTRLKSPHRQAQNTKNKPDHPDAPSLDLEDMKEQLRKEQEMAALAAQIAKQNHDYQSRPRKAFVGARAKQTSAAMYYDTFRRRIEDIGEKIYPVDELGRKLYGSLIISIAIDYDGRLIEDLTKIEKSSGNAMLDAHALRIIKIAAPFSRLPADLQETDANGNPTGKPAQYLVITNRWSFEKAGSELTAQ